MPATSSRSRASTGSPSEELEEEGKEIPEVTEPGFLSRPIRQPDDLDPTVTTVSSPSDGPGGVSDVGSDASGDYGSGPTTSTTDAGRLSPASTSPPPELPSLEDLARTLVGLASIGVRWVRSRRRPLPEGVWIATEDDQAAIGDPLARIAERHAPAGVGGSSDMVDGLCIGVGVTAYTLKGLEAEAPPPVQLREADLDEGP